MGVLWIIGYPIYLYKRKYYGLPNRVVAGILMAIVFIGSWSVMSTAIDGKIAEVRGITGIEQMQ